MMAVQREYQIHADPSPERMRAMTDDEFRAVLLRKLDELVTQGMVIGEKLAEIESHLKPSGSR